jgi:hypothetical protein
MSQMSTGLSDFEKKGSAVADTDLGAFTIPEFAALFRMCRSTVYNEARAGRLNIAKVGNKALITKGEARRYQRALEASGVAQTTP